MTESENLSGKVADEAGTGRACDPEKVCFSELPENNLATGFVGA